MLSVASDAGQVRPTARLTQQVNDRFEQHTGAVLQFFPSSQRISVALETPLILGRKGTADLEEILDLTTFDAYQQGVSRHHCLLQREGTYLTVIDLGSANGTCLNGKRLPAYQKHIVAHGDHLLLGRLHLMISFNSTGPE
jgi:pSer/pThr/pTyr-binding forkhead associated (FHA) protein